MCVSLPRVALDFSITLAAWLHDLDPFVWEISGGFGIRWYGVSYIAGFVWAWFVLRWLAKRGASLLRAEYVADAMIALVLGALLGGRLGYILFYQPSLLWAFFPSAPWWGVLAINHGGMASHGGMIGVMLAGLWVARRERLPRLHVLDLVCFAAPVGLLFGRLANFINGELLGVIVAAPGEEGPWWTVKFPQELATDHAPKLSLEQALQLRMLLESFTPNVDSVKAQVGGLLFAVQHNVSNAREQIAPLLASRAPSQLFQAAAEGVVLSLLLWVIWAKPRKPGVVGAWFLIGYGVMRIITEMWRLPDDHLLTNPAVLGLSRGQWLSVVMVGAGVVVLVLSMRRTVLPIGGWRQRRAEKKPSASPA